MACNMILFLVVLHKRLVQGLIWSSMIIGQNFQIQFGYFNFLLLKVHHRCSISIIKRGIHIRWIHHYHRIFGTGSIMSGLLIQVILNRKWTKFFTWLNDWKRLLLLWWILWIKNRMGCGAIVVLNWVVGSLEGALWVFGVGLFSGWGCICGVLGGLWICLLCLVGFCLDVRNVNKASSLLCYLIIWTIGLIKLTKALSITRLNIIITSSLKVIHNLYILKIILPIPHNILTLPIMFPHINILFLSFY